MELLREQLGNKNLMKSFHFLGYAQLTGFGSSFGSNLAGLDPRAFEEMCVDARTLSLIELESFDRYDLNSDVKRWRLHPLIAEYLRLQLTKLNYGNLVQDRIHQWFMIRLPEKKECEDNWAEVLYEKEALVEWIEKIPEHQWVIVERAASRFAMSKGPYDAWFKFCEKALTKIPGSENKANFLWTLANIAKPLGRIDRALKAIRERKKLLKPNKNNKEFLITVSLEADIMQVQGIKSDLIKARKYVQDGFKELLDGVSENSENYSTLLIEYAEATGRTIESLLSAKKIENALEVYDKELKPFYGKLPGKIKLMVDGRYADIRYEFARRISFLGNIEKANSDLECLLKFYDTKIIPKCEKFGMSDTLAKMNGKKATILIDLKYFDAAHDLLKQEVIPIFVELGDVYSEAFSWGRLANCYSHKNRFDESIKLRLQKELPIFRDLFDKENQILCLMNLGGDYKYRNKSNDEKLAKQCFSEVLTIAGDLGSDEETKWRKILKENNLY